MDSLKSETQEFSSSHGQWATLRRGYNFMDHEDKLTKKHTKKLRINFTERRGAKYFSNTWKRRIIVWLHVSNWMWTLKDPEASKIQRILLIIIKIAFQVSLAWSELIKWCPTLASYSGRSFPTIYKSPDRSFSSAGVGHCLILKVVSFHVLSEILNRLILSLNPRPFLRPPFDPFPSLLKTGISAS